MTDKTDQDFWESDPQAALGWARDYMVHDLLEAAQRLRQQAEFLEGRASLLSAILTAATRQSHLGMTELHDDAQGCASNAAARKGDNAEFYRRLNAQTRAASHKLLDESPPRYQRPDRRETTISGRAIND